MIHLSMIPHSFVEKFNVKGKAYNGYIFSGVTKVIYGIPKSGLIAHYDLVKYLEPYVYRPSRKTPGLWTHNSQPINFILVFDDFGVKYLGK